MWQKPSAPPKQCPGLQLTTRGRKELQDAYPRLESLSFPRNDCGKTVELACGRRLGYCEHVDPNTPTAQLRNVVLLPGVPGSRLFTHPSITATGFVPGWRLVVLERPGLGLSDAPPEGYTYTQFAADFREFCQLMGLRRVAVIGFSAAGAVEVQVAGSAGAEEEAGPPVVVAGVALVSAIGPPDTPNKRQGMAMLFQFAYWACAYAPWLVGFIVRSEAAALRRRPVHAMREAFKPYSGAADVAALKRPEVEAAFLESGLELYSRGQEAAVLRENLQFAAAPWGLDLGACSTRVAIWQGGQDRGCTLHVLPDQGHMLYFDVWGQVVAWVDECLASR
eukprot:XP_001693196.1 predicted protein [Chlamydomonas reinhardtii]